MGKSNSNLTRVPRMYPESNQNEIRIIIPDPKDGKRSGYFCSSPRKKKWKGMFRGHILDKVSVTPSNQREPD